MVKIGYHSSCEHGVKIKRVCNLCGIKFTARSKFQRSCRKCRCRKKSRVYSRG